MELRTEFALSSAETAQQVTPSLETARDHESERFPRFVQLRAIGMSQKCREIYAILRACTVVPREDLQRDEVSQPSDGIGEAWERFDSIRCRNNLRFNA